MICETSGGNNVVMVVSMATLLPRCGNVVTRVQASARSSVVERARSKAIAT